MSDATPMTYRVAASVAIAFTIRDPDAIERVTGPAGDEWRSQFYPLHTLGDVLDHWTHNLLTNDVRDVSRLEGWADLEPAAVTVDVEYVGVDFGG